MANLVSFEYDDNLAGARSVTDLMAIQWLGDKPHQKTRFLKIFLNIVQNLKDSQFTQEGLRDVLAKNMSNSNDMKMEMEAYRIAPVNSPVHSFQYLLTTLTRSIQRDQREAGIEARDKEIARMVAGNYPNEIDLVSQDKEKKRKQPRRKRLQQFRRL